MMKSYSLTLLFLLAAMRPGWGQSAIFELQTRPVSEFEIANGVPAGTVIDLFATTEEDILALGLRELSGDFFQHELAWDSKVAPPELMDLHPTLPADSWFTTPGSTLVLGDGFGLQPDRETLWGDLSRDGPVTDFQFGRLTVPYGTTASMSGQFDLRGEYGPQGYLFDFSVDATGLANWEILDHVVTPKPQPILPPPAPEAPPTLPAPDPLPPEPPTIDVVPIEDPPHVPSEDPVEVVPIQLPPIDPVLPVELPVINEPVFTIDRPIIDWTDLQVTLLSIEPFYNTVIPIDGNQLQIATPVVLTATIDTNLVFDGLARPIDRVSAFDAASIQADAGGFANLVYLRGGSADNSANTAVPEPQALFMAISAIVGLIAKNRRRLIRS